MPIALVVVVLVLESKVLLSFNSENLLTMEHSIAPKKEKKLLSTGNNQKLWSEGKFQASDLKSKRSFFNAGANGKLQVMQG